MEQYGSGVMVCRWPLERVDRAVTEGNTDGFIKVVHRPNGKILGVTIAGGAAGEAIHEWILAMNQGISISAVARSMHVYPTYSIGNQQAALSVTLGPDAVRVVGPDNQAVGQGAGLAEARQNPSCRASE